MMWSSIAIAIGLGAVFDGTSTRASDRTVKPCKIGITTAITTGTHSRTVTSPPQRVTSRIRVQTELSSSKPKLSTSSTTASSYRPEATSSKSFAEMALERTNTYRLQYSAGPLRWNETVAARAQTWAMGCVADHPPPPREDGQNIFWYTYSGGKKPTLQDSVVAEAIDLWASEEAAYNYASGVYSDETGHFTQLVWRASTDLGCYLHDCEGKGNLGLFLVCNYYPPGNFAGRFEDNVGHGEYSYRS